MTGGVGGSTIAVGVIDPWQRTERGIRLLLYYCNGGSEAAWAEASGYNSTDRTRYYDNFCRIFTEIGERYGDRIAGYWFDFCPFNVSHRFERVFAAAKAGSAARIVAWNSWVIRQPSDFRSSSPAKLPAICCCPMRPRSMTCSLIS